MPLFTRKIGLPEAIEAIRGDLRDRPGGPLSTELGELLEMLRRRNEPIVRSGAARTPVDDVLEALPDAAALVEVGGAIAARNEQFVQMLGSSRGTVLEATRSGEVNELALRALAGWTAKAEVVLPAIDVRVLAIASPLAQSRALLLLRDLTAQRRAEAMRRDFIANASHELRTPVTAIAGAAETLLGGGLPLDAGARPFVEAIARQAQRLSRLTQDLLDLSRLESGEWKPEIGPLELEPMCGSLIEMFRPRAEARKIVLAADVPPNLKVRADRRALEQILTNLLDNAVKYTPDGGRVTLLADGLGAQGMISVVDTGPGIDPRNQQRIFERFYRADTGRSRDQGGTGLGLAIAKHLAQAMAGEVGVESGRGGSRFWVKLPAA